MGSTEEITRRILIAGHDMNTTRDLQSMLVDDMGASKSQDDQASRQVFIADVVHDEQAALDSIRASLLQGAPFAVAFVEVSPTANWNGTQLVQSIWDLDQEIQVVLYANHTEPDWCEFVCDLGVSDRFLCLQRPFNRSQVNQFANALTAKWLVSTTDSLTGIPNRRCFMEHLSREWSRSVRHHMPLTCAVVDLDFFKRINDSYGHAVGDRVLIQVAHALRRCCRIGDFVSRLGGEEFAILLPETSECDALIWANKIREVVSSLSIDGLDADFVLTMSVGLAERNAHCRDTEDLLDRADQTMLVAKNAGRNRAIAYSSQEGFASSDSSHPLDQLTARDIMTTPVHCLKATDSVKTAADLFLTLRINSVPIVDDHDALVGIVSEKDLITSISHGKNTADPLADLMTKSVVRFEEETSAREIHDFLGRANIRRIVVVKHGVPTGVISRGTVLRWYQSLSLMQTDSNYRSSLGGICLDPDERMTQARQIARVLSHHAAKLEAELEQEDCNLVPLIVGGASELQELVGDMLAYSQFASMPEQVR